MLEPSELFPEVPNLYEFLSVHADMIFDQERVSCYKNAIDSVVKPGDVVADIGTGTGLLAFLSLRAGARHIHAIEKSPAIKWAKRLAEKHGFADDISFYQADSREVELPEKVDVVISELIGHIAFEEGMAESLFDARSRFLHEDGVIIPQKVSLVAVPVCEKELYERSIACWRPAWGIDYSLLKEDAVTSCYLTEISNDLFMSTPATILTTDIVADQATTELSDTHTFRICRPGEVNGIALWFDAELV